jgi:hypothetical protein
MGRGSLNFVWKANFLFEFMSRTLPEKKNHKKSEKKRKTNQENQTRRKNQNITQSSFAHCHRKTRTSILPCIERNEGMPSCHMSKHEHSDDRRRQRGRHCGRTAARNAHRRIVDIGIAPGRDRRIAAPHWCALSEGGNEPTRERNQIGGEQDVFSTPFLKKQVKKR